MTIDVTADDIRLGARKSPLHCPLARALKRATGAEVPVQSDTPGWPGTSLYGLPVVACDFVRRFDAGRCVEPFSFDVERLIMIATKIC